MDWRVATFNVNGIRARLPHVLDWLQRFAPDLLCMQEIKCPEAEFPAEPFEALGYTVSLRGQKGFNGVAILSRVAPDAVVRAFGDGGPEEEARFIAVRLGAVWAVNTYVPQGRSPDDPAFARKLDFFERLRGWLSGRFSPAEPIVWVGDMNVAPEPLDVFDPKRMAGKVGFHPDEHAALAGVKAWGFEDLFRRMHPGERQFTFWDYRLPKSVERDLGWRIDHILATEPLARACTGCAVDVDLRRREKASDHTPVWADFALEEAFLREETPDRGGLA